jgi:hypothetical protein
MSNITSLFLNALFFIGLLLAASAPINAQNNSFSAIDKANLQDFGTIKDGEEVTGYYFFYEEKSNSNKDRNYVVSLLDQNLNSIGKKTIEADRYTTVREGVYNGEYLALKFADHKKQKFNLRLFDKTGALSATHSLPYGIFDAPKYEAQMEASGMNNQRLVSLPGKGFIDYGMSTKRGIMSQTLYTITFVPNDESLEGWSYSTPEKSDEYEFAGFLAANDKVLLSTVGKKKGLMKKDIDLYMLGTDIATGKKLFETRIKNRKYDILITNAWVKENNIQLFGQYYPKGSKVEKESSLGLCTFTMDFDGNADNYLYSSWEKDFSKLLPSNKKGKIEDIGYLFFHDYIITPSGSIIGVAENYRKTFSAGGAASKVLSRGTSGGSSAKVVVEDLYLFEFAPDFSLKGVEVVDKQKHNVFLPSGAAFFSPQLLSLIVKGLQGFDYVLTQKEDDYFTVGYTDFEKRKKEQNGLIYGAVSYVDGGFTNDKVDLTTDAEELRVLPAKSGYVAIWEYYQKEKKMNIRLERINF